MQFCLIELILRYKVPFTMPYVYNNVVLFFEKKKYKNKDSQLQW